MCVCVGIATAKNDKKNSQTEQKQIFKKITKKGRKRLKTNF